MTLAQEAERFRNMSDAQYADLQNGRTTVEAIVTAPDYAEKIAERQLARVGIDDSAKLVTVNRSAMLGWLAQAAREGYNLGHAAR
jgi:hypothetical protein